MKKRNHIFLIFGSILIFSWIFLTWYYTSKLEQTKNTLYNFALGKFVVLDHRIYQIEYLLKRQHGANVIALDSLRKLNRFSTYQNGSVRKSNETLSNVLEKYLDLDSAEMRIPVLVIACNRPSSVKSHLDQLLRYRPSAEQFPIIVSQDCGHKETENVIRSYGDLVTFIQQPDQSVISLFGMYASFRGYYKIARHYHWALNQTFLKFGYESAIITEDDLDIAVDFFEYFMAGNRLLQKDPTIWCISAWNDNGKRHLIENSPKLLKRTDFFGGLGWLTTKSIWLELEPKWPQAFWDDWMRKPDIRKDRVCIRPEISRTSMNDHARIGVSKGLFFEKHLKGIQLNNVSVPFTEMNLDYLLKVEYDYKFASLLAKAVTVSLDDLKRGYLQSGSALPKSMRLIYTDMQSFNETAKYLNILEDMRSGIPRMAYKGVVEVFVQNLHIHISPPDDWRGYNSSWH